MLIFVNQFFILIVIDHHNFLYFTGKASNLDYVFEHCLAIHRFLVMLVKVHVYDCKANMQN